MATASSRWNLGLQPNTLFTLEQSSFKKFASWGPPSGSLLQDALPPQYRQNRSASSPVVTQSQSSGPTL